MNKKQIANNEADLLDHWIKVYEKKEQIEGELIKTIVDRVDSNFYALGISIGIIFFLLIGILIKVW